MNQAGSRTGVPWVISALAYVCMAVLRSTCHIIRPINEASGSKARVR
jgi:hypothetical protein